MKSYKKVITWGLIIVISLWLSTFFLCFIDESSRGIFGDMFGVTNALFSGLAFCGIIITIIMQREELMLQREELKSTREVFEEQSKLMSEQQRDNTFFNLLSNHRQMVDSFKKTNNKIIGNIFKPQGVINETVSGYEIIGKIVEQWHTQLSWYSNSFNDKIIHSIDKSTQHPIELIDNEEDVIGLYEEICHIYEYIEKQFQDQVKNKFYKDTIWKSLSINERILFEIIHFNSTRRNKQLDFISQFYSKFNFVDFRICKLPTISSKIIHKGNSINDFEIISDSEILISEFVFCFKNKNRIIEFLDSFKICENKNGNLYFVFQNLLEKYRLILNNWKDELVIDQLPIIHSVVNINGVEFDYLFKLDIRNSINNLNGGTEYHLNSISDIVREDAKDILKLLKGR